MAKPHLSVCFLGHVDSGKSTTIGHLMLQLGKIDQQLVDKNGEKAAEIGKSSFKYAWVMDKLPAERERGITIDVSPASLLTSKYEVTVIDCPGHRDYIKNMLTGTSQADSAILVVSAIPNELKAGLSPHGQTRQHAFFSICYGHKAYYCSRQQNGLYNPSIQ